MRRLFRYWRARRTYRALCRAYEASARNRADWKRWEG